MTLFMILLDYKCRETLLMAPLRSAPRESADLAAVGAHQLVKLECKDLAFTDSHPEVGAGLEMLADQKSVGVSVRITMRLRAPIGLTSGCDCYASGVLMVILLRHRHKVDHRRAGPDYGLLLSWGLLRSPKQASVDRFR
jgi:hypothetical protein